MTTNQEGRLQSIVDYYGLTTNLNHGGIYMQMFDSEGITAGTFNGRMIEWLQNELSSSKDNINDLLQEYAELRGFDNWSSMNNIFQFISNNTICLALSKIVYDYSGNCLRLRRSSDDAEKDFGFNNSGDIDTSSISTWGTTDTLYVVTWYDQSTSNNNATQSTKVNQPEWNNTNKEIVFTAASSQFLKISDNDTIDVGTSDFSYVSKVNFTSLSTAHVFFKGSFSSPRTYIRIYYFSGELNFAIEDVTVPEENAEFASISTSTDYNLIGIKEGTNIKAYKNGSLSNTTALGTFGSLSTTSDLFIGSQNGLEYLDGSMKSLMLFKKALNTQEIDLLNNIL